MRRVVLRLRIFAKECHPDLFGQVRDGLRAGQASRHLLHQPDIFMRGRLQVSDGLGFIFIESIFEFRPASCATPLRPIGVTADLTYAHVSIGELSECAKLISQCVSHSLCARRCAFEIRIEQVCPVRSLDHRRDDRLPFAVRALDLVIGLVEVAAQRGPGVFQLLAALALIEVATLFRLDPVARSLIALKLDRASDRGLCTTSKSVIEAGFELCLRPLWNVRFTGDLGEGELIDGRIAALFAVSEYLPASRFLVGRAEEVFILGKGLIGQGEGNGAIESIPASYRCLLKFGV